jgi:hypothetical protein
VRFPLTTSFFGTSLHAVSLLATMLDLHLHQGHPFLLSKGERLSFYLLIYKEYKGKKIFVGRKVMLHIYYFLVLKKIALA